MSQETQQKIREKAYKLFLARGANQGSDIDDWLTAEREVLGVAKPVQRGKKKGI